MCVYCKQGCRMPNIAGCGWNQLVSPETATLRAIHDSWMSKRYPKIGIQTRRDYNNAWNKLKPLWDVPVSKGRRGRFTGRPRFWMRRFP